MTVQAGASCSDIDFKLERNGVVFYVDADAVCDFDVENNDELDNIDIQGVVVYRELEDEVVEEKDFVFTKEEWKKLENYLSSKAYEGIDWSDCY